MLKDEQVATVRCVKCDRHFLLLDSEDYWFDVIQTGYPKLTTCTCKGTLFRIELDYRLRDDGDVEQVTLSTICTACRKNQRRMSIHIDYSPTKRLLQKPLVPCKNPDIRYDLVELSLYVKANDIARIARWLAEHGCSFAGQIRVRDQLVVRQLSIDQVAELITRKVSYLPHYCQLYAMPKRCAVRAAEISTARKEAAFWKRSELVRIDSPTTIVWGSRTGQLYSIQFSGEYTRGQSVVAKSSRFRKLTAELLQWLSTQFVSWRGSDCFDNEQVHRRLFGKEFHP
jgi:hypothetical protein